MPFLLACLLLALLFCWSENHQRHRAGLPPVVWFSWGSRTPRHHPAAKRSPRPRPINTNLNARLSKGKGRIPQQRSPRPKPKLPWRSPPVPDAVPVKAPLPPRPTWLTTPAKYQHPGPRPPAHVLVRLDALTNDPAASERLVSLVKARNPSRDWSWCADKAIWDLERDRH